MPVDEALFKLALSHFASGVTVVTTEHDGKPYGMTVASFASLSLHPPLVLVCVEKSVKTHQAIGAAGKFGVSILTQEQAESRRSSPRAATTSSRASPFWCALPTTVRHEGAGGRPVWPLDAAKLRKR